MKRSRPFNVSLTENSMKQTTGSSRLALMGECLTTSRLSISSLRGLRSTRWFFIHPFISRDQIAHTIRSLDCMRHLYIEPTQKSRKKKYAKPTEIQSNPQRKKNMTKTSVM